MRRLIQDWLGKAGVAAFRTRGRYHQDGLFTVHNSHFREDPEFRAAYDRGIQASRGMDPGFEWRVHVALWAAAASLRVEGDFVECGVNAGFMSSAILQGLRWNVTGRRFFLVDTFAGPVMAQYSQAEAKKGRVRIAEKALAAGAYVVDLERVRANYAEWPGVVVVQGAVPEVLGKVDAAEVAFLHLDMNCAYPERAALERLWERMRPGAMSLLDDYAYFGHEEQAAAMDEAARGLGTTILSLPTGQGLIIK